MKTRITRNEVKNLAPRRIAVGYCELQHLLRHTPCTHYNAGVYGWNFDVYIVYGAAGNPKTAITTGYRNTGGTKPGQGLVRKYETAAKIIVEQRISYEKQIERINNLRDEFIAKVFENQELTRYEKLIRQIVKRSGGYREKAILENSYILEKDGTWSDDHQVIHIIDTDADANGTQRSFAVDLVTKTICA